MRFAIVLLVIASTSRLAAQGGPTTSIGGRSVSVTEGDSSRTNSLTTKAVRLSGGQSLQETLRQSGVEPNSDALSVVYSLNPGIYKLTDASSYTVQIPALKGFEPSSSAPVRLQVDAELKQSIASQARTLDSITSSSPAEMRGSLYPVIGELKETSVSIGVHPTSSPFLEQVQRESSLLNKYSTKGALSDSDKAIIAEINSDLRAKNKALQEDEPDPDVIVKTLAEKDQSEVPLLTICYAPVFLDSGKCDAEFERPSSPTDHRLPVANYHVWATNSAGLRVSEVKRVEVRGSATVVLVVTQ